MSGGLEGYHANVLRVGGIPPEFKILPHLHHRIHEVYLTSSVSYHIMAASIADRTTEVSKAKGAANFKKHTSLKAMRNALPSVFESKMGEEFLWKKV